MENVFQLRVLVDTQDDKTIFRDIEIKGSQTFLELHHAIQQAFEFDNSQLASFYMSNEDWDKGQEITLMDIPFDDGSVSASMSATKIGEMVSLVGDKVLYVFDFMLMWCFYIDVVKILPLEEKAYPICVNSFGDSPNQYSKEVLLDPNDDKLLLKNKKKGSSSDDSEEDIFDGFDDFDNLV